MLILSSALLFDINPVYVVMFSLLWKFFDWGSSSKSARKMDVASAGLMKRVDKDTKDTNSSNEYDYVLLGNNIGTYFAAALLSRAGYSCCIVCCPLNYPPSEVLPTGWAAPIPLQCGSVTNVTLYQNLLDMAQNLDPGRRVIFKPVGSAESLYTHSMICSTHLRCKKNSKQKAMVTPLFTGKDVLASIVSYKSSSDETNLVILFQKVRKCFESVKIYLTSKISRKATQIPKDFFELSAHTCKSIIHHLCIGNSLFDRIGVLAMFGADSEASSTESLSVLSLASAINSCEDGIFVPEGGISYILKNLSDVILASGGAILKDALAEGLVLEKDATDQTFATGVKLWGDDSSSSVLAKKGVLSGLGILCTYCKLLPSHLVGEKTRMTLKEYVERVPKLIVIFEVNGTKEKLGLSSVKYVESKEQKIGDTLVDKDGETLAQNHFKIWSPTVHDNKLSQCFDGRNVVIVEMCADSSMVKAAEFLGFSHCPISNNIDDCSNTKHKRDPIIFSSITTNHSEKNIGHPVILSDSSIENIKEKARMKVLAVYPKCQDNIMNIHVVPPFVGGHKSSANVRRFTSDISPEDPNIRGLYLCSEDLGVPGMQGDIQAGYMGACAALNYSCSSFGSRIPFN